MRGCEIAGWGTYLPGRVVTVGGRTRYRVADGVTQLDMLEQAAAAALGRADARASGQ